jgi:nitrogen fixation protein FixH
MKRGWQWPLGVAAVLLLSTAGQIWFAVVASRDEAFAVENDYCGKTVAWDAELRQRDTNAQLGWRISPTLALAGDGADGALSIELRDAAGSPIAGAVVDVLAMHNARAAHQLSATLIEGTGGTYRALLPAKRPGQWELRFSVQRGTERFTASERIDASPH